MRFLRQSLTGLFLVSLTLGLLVWAGQMVVSAVETRMSQEPRMPPVRERVFAVNAVAAEAGVEAPVLQAFGQVQSRRMLEIRASAAGRLLELGDAFEDGGQVEKGDLLARIDPADPEAELARVRSDRRDAEGEAREAAAALELAEADLEAAREQAALREKAYQRQLDLQDRGVGTAAAVEDAELAASSARQQVVARRQAVAQAQARIDQAETALARSDIALAEAERRLADTEIRAGFSGTLSGVTVVEGGLVSVNEQLGTLVDADALEVQFRVSTAQYARLLDGNGRLRDAEVRVTLDIYGTDLTATGRLSRDSAAVGEGQTGRLVYARLDGARGLKPGDFVTVEVDEPPLRGVVRLPASALDAQGAVLVIGADERLEVVPVELLRRQGDDVIVSAEGIDGRQVVAERTPLLGAGIKVRPLQPSAGPDASPDASPGATPDAAPEPEAADMVELSEERRARLVAFVEDNDFIPDAAKERILAALSQDQVPAQMVQRIESRMGG